MLVQTLEASVRGSVVNLRSQNFRKWLSSAREVVRIMSAGAGDVEAAAPAVDVDVDVTLLLEEQDDDDDDDRMLDL
jgi:hypothetical protein